MLRTQNQGSYLPVSPKIQSFLKTGVIQLADFSTSMVTPTEKRIPSPLTNGFVHLIETIKRL